MPFFTRSTRTMRLELDALISQRRELDRHIDALARDIARREFPANTPDQGHRVLLHSMATTTTGSNHEQ